MVATMKFVVGSTNPVKVNAVKSAIKKMLKFSDSDFHVIAVGVESGVPDQPITLDDIILGATNRAERAMQKIPEASLSFGIEAGITKMPRTITGYIDFAVCVTLDEEGRKTIGFSPGFEYPPFVIKKIFDEKKEVGQIFDELLGEKDVKKKIGAIGILTGGIIPRELFVELSVIMALVPRIPNNFHLYFQK